MTIGRRSKDWALRRRLLGALAFIGVLLGGLGAVRPAMAESLDARAPDAVRIALFNVSLARNEPRALIEQLRAGGAPQIEAIVEVLQRVDADIVVLLEFDWDRAGAALELFAAELIEGRGGAEGVDYPYRLHVPVNAGDPTGLDLDGDGSAFGPEDAFGWGVFPGQFGIAVLSRYPIDRDAVRTFRLLRWSETPYAAWKPMTPAGAPFYSDAAWSILRLSSKTHLDAPVLLPSGTRLHLLVSHPTPPVYDGPEDRNGARNAAEIALWLDYISPDVDHGWIRDDQGRVGGLADDALFVLAGDLNLDPLDGRGRRDVVQALLDSALITDPRPLSSGAAAAALTQGEVNMDHRGDAALDTADWRDAAPGGPGNLRVDYLLPSAALEILGSAVFWPAPDDPLYPLVGDGHPVVSSDHRLVWLDIQVP